MREQNQSYEEGIEEEGISLKELILVLFKGKTTIAICTVVVLIVTLIGSLVIPNLQIGTKGQVDSVVQLYFPSIKEGLQPDGTAYDVNEIKGADILQKALDNIALSNNPNLTKLSNAISFQAVLPEDVAKTLENIKDLKTEQLKLERLESLKVNPDTYIITLEIKNSLGISKEEGRELLDNVIWEYKNYLVEKNSGYKILSNVFAKDFSVENYDYIQSVDLLDTQLNGMIEYVELNISNNDFVSVSTGLSKDDIKNALDSIKLVDVEQLFAYVSGNYITKDPQKSVAVYENLALEKERLFAAKSEEAGALKLIIEEFKGNEQNIIMGGDEANSISIKSESEQYNSFVEKYIAAGNVAVIASADADYYRNEAQRFSSENLEGITTKGENTEEGKQLKNQIGQTIDKLTNWTKTINMATTDYYKEMTYKQYVEQLIPANAYDVASSINIMLNLAIALVAGIMLGILVVLFKAYMREEKNETGQGETSEVLKYE